MARGAPARSAPVAGRARAEAIDLDDLEGDYDDEEDDAGDESVDVSVKSEQSEEEDGEALLEGLRAAAGGVPPAAPSRDKLSDDPLRLLEAFVPPGMTEKAIRRPSSSSCSVTCARLS